MVRYTSDEITVIAKTSTGELGEPPSADGTACLIVLSGANVGQVYALETDQVLIGREDGADIQLLDAGISRRHAMLERVDDGGFLLRDAGSRNGTYANNRRLDGAHALRDGDKVQVGVMTILKFSYGDDIEADYAQKMYDAALRDDLTGIFNRRYLDDRLRSEFSFARRHQSALALLLIDLDHFKTVNDTRGHLAGDEILKDFATRVSRIIRVEDVLARFGGEEFCVLCRDTDLLQASILAERIRHETSASPYNINAGQIAAGQMDADASQNAGQVDAGQVIVTVSIGVVAIPDPTINDAEAMIELADGALYQAKTRGRNCVITRRLDND